MLELYALLHYTMMPQSKAWFLQYMEKNNNLN